MDSLTTLAYLKPTTAEKLFRLRQFYEDEYVLHKHEATYNVANTDNIISDSLTPKTARRLLALLLSVVGEGAESINVRAKLTPAAKAALEVLLYFYRKDALFRAAVEKYEAAVLTGALKLQAHLKDENAAHRALALELAEELVENVPKLESWIDTDEAEAAAAAEKQKRAEEERKRQEAEEEEEERPLARPGAAPPGELPPALLEEVELEEKEGVKKALEEAAPGEAVAAPPEAAVPTHRRRPSFREAQPTHLPPEGLYYDTEVSVLVDTFSTNFEQGLSDADIPARIARYGENKLPEPPPPSPLKMLLKQLKDFMVLTLLAVAVLSFGLQDFIEATVLVLVVVVNVTIGFVQEWKAERALLALKSLGVSTATVMRNGVQVDIESKQIVPGDIVLLEEGDAVPADLRLFEAVNLDVIESVLTGEAEPVTKTVAAIRKAGLTVGDRTNMAFMSTNVARGRGKGIVVATATQTEMGQISQALTKPVERQTLLQMRLSKLGKMLVAIAVVLCLVVVGIVFLWTWSRKGFITGDDALQIIKVGISLAVSVIPEGLVAVTTVTMAISVQRMAAANAVVRELTAVETVGSLTTICSDKTGTLTEGKMTAQALYAGGRAFEITGGGLEPKGEFTTVNKDGEVETVHVDALPTGLAAALLTCSLCNNSTISEDKAAKIWISTGDPTEAALTVAAYKGQMSKADLPGYKFISEIPFDSDRKRMIVVYEVPKEGRTVPVPSDETAPAAAVVLGKGAPEAVVSICNRRVTESGTVESLTESAIEKIEHQNGQMALKGMRVLALAYSTLDDQRTTELKAFEERKRQGVVESPEPVNLRSSHGRKRRDPLASTENNLIFVGLVGLIDPPRPAVKDSIAACRRAGIRVCMITGDHPRTAFAIATQLGITGPNDEDLVAKGSELDSLGTGQLSGLEPFPTVFARVSPANKLKIVSALQLRGEIVGMTGDGVNDAPAIKNSDVGIAMGRTATDLTKESADIILTDDNFTTIVAAVKEGRRTYDNIRKFVMYLLACNSAEIYTMLIAAIAGLPTPFTPIMILWANLIADIPPALALGVDPHQPDVLKRKPRNPKAGIFTLRSFVTLLAFSLSMSAVAIAIYCVALFGLNYDSDISLQEQQHPDRVTHAKTLAFVALTTVQLFHSFIARSNRTVFRRDIFANRWLIAASGSSLGLLILGDYVPGLNQILNQMPLDGIDWGLIACGLVFHVTFTELFKIYLQHSHSKSKHSNMLFYNDA